MVRLGGKGLMLDGTDGWLDARLRFLQNVLSDIPPCTSLCPRLGKHRLRETR